ncbi:hypothetical protein BH10PLA2_BH10PLA2_03250 [soil metagenome]
MNSWNPRANEIFLSALERENGRQTFLDKACGDDTDLRHHVDALLEAQERAGSFLCHPAQSATASADPFVTSTMLLAERETESSGMRLGRYQLQHKLGEGGFGVVWMAEQTEPLHRRVAIKIIKSGVANSSILARFEQERQALALMDHPNIARVLDAGTVEVMAEEWRAAFENGIDNRIPDTGPRGFRSRATQSPHCSFSPATRHSPPATSFLAPATRPYFVMELVEGVPFTQYCNQARRNVRERLELFIPVCQAVQHAHQKGIIHRDLKPSNVLVATYDDKPIPKVIDFGIAKATGPKLTDKTLSTEAGQLIGTLEYMSPEQADFGNVDIDTRADIYSLGVMLYELLTGRPPFSAASGHGLDTMLRLVREVEPPIPSVKLTHEPDLALISAQRGLDPRRLSQQIRGDLDWVVMKCLAKERGRRYESASSLARDLARLLANEPVTAGPPSVGYRLRKFVRRNRGPVFAAGIVLTVLVVGTIGTALGLVEARKERRAALDSAAKATQAAGAESQALLTARKRLVQLEKVNEILSSVFSNLDAADSEGGDGALARRIAERLDSAAALLQGDCLGDELAVARLQRTLGHGYASLGFGSKAIPILLQASATFSKLLSPDAEDLLFCQSDLADAYLVVGKRDEALALYSQVQAQHLRRLGPDHRITLKSGYNLAVALCFAGRDQRSVALHEQVLARQRVVLGPNDPDTLSTEIRLAQTYKAIGNWQKALPLYESALPRIKAKHGTDHAQTLDTLDALGIGYVWAGNWNKALPILEEVVAKNRVRRGPEHPATLSSLSNLGWAKLSSGKEAEALHIFQPVLEARRSILGPDHPCTLQCMNSLGMAFSKTGQFEKAIPLLEKTLEKRKVILGVNHADTLGTMNNLAQAYRFSGQYPKAMVLYRQALEQVERTLGPKHFQSLATAFNLGLACRDMGRLDESIALLEKTLARSKVVPGPRHHLTMSITESLAALYERTGRFHDAEVAFAELVAISKSIYGSAHFQTAYAQVQWGEMLLKQGKYAQAEQPLRACVEFRQRMQPDHWSTWNAQSLLGQSLCGQKQFAAAETLLLEGYLQMKQREGQLPPGASMRLVEAAHRLVGLYQSLPLSEAGVADCWDQTEQNEYVAAVGKLCVGMGL